MRSLVIIMALSSALVACTGPTEVASAPPGVSYRVNGSDVSDANLRADRYCQQYARRAVLDGLSQSGGGQIANYSCR